MKALWWLIQINAVVCFYLFYAVGTSEASTVAKIVSFIVLLLAALLEYIGYHRIYKATT